MVTRRSARPAAGPPPDPRQIRQLTRLLLRWYPAHARDLPWRRRRAPYEVFVSEIMLQQTQVKTVIPYWECWMRELPTLQSVAEADPATLHKLWEGLGYYRRVRHLQQAAQTIQQRHGGVFPSEFDDVLALPGIGRYTAGAICSIAFGQPTPILDGNVIRILTRIFGIAGPPRQARTNARLWQLAGVLVQAAPGLAPAGGTPPCATLNQALMELGALVCTPRSPACDRCPVNRLCRARRENRTQEWPNLEPRPPAIARRFVALVLARAGRLLARQRPAGVVNAGLWEFPNWELAAPRTTAEALARRQLGRPDLALEPLPAIKHSITRHRITLESFLIRVRQPPPGVAGVWLSPAGLRQRAFTAAHKKLATFAVQRMLSDR